MSFSAFEPNYLTFNPGPLRFRVTEYKAYSVRTRGDAVSPDKVDFGLASYARAGAALGKTVQVEAWESLVVK